MARHVERLNSMLPCKRPINSRIGDDTTTDFFAFELTAVATTLSLDSTNAILDVSCILFGVPGICIKTNAMNRTTIKTFLLSLHITLISLK